MLPDGDKIAARNKARRDRLFHEWGGDSYRLICKVCGVVMKDQEPLIRGGEHIHPVNDCPHSAEGVFHPYEYPGDRRGSRWVSVFRPKKYRRARKLSRKFRKSLT